MPTPQCVFYEGDKARARLLTQDAFLSRLTRSDYAFRLKKADYDDADFRRLLESSVLNWTDDERAKLNACMASALSGYGTLSLFIPETIGLIKTNGQEEPGNAYCRNDNNIVIHPAALTREPARLTRLLIHELFHLISRNNPVLKERLYNTLGFFKGEELLLPDSLADATITNPDSPANDFFFIAKQEGAPRLIYPVLQLAPCMTMGDMKIKACFIDSTTFERVDTKEINNDGSCIGHNSDAAIQPEECMAEQVTAMILNERVDNQELIERIERIFLDEQHITGALSLGKRHPDMSPPSP
ncbi:hypothetical protein [Aeromonas diversa]|uniref:hypothetical protein n=1 Tax=Aeromonas diversa TaxID=502790 RepID=UPI003462C7E9